MAAKKVTVGGEIDAWCTKCKLDLNHRVIAMVGDQAKRVECSTCGSHHNYYKPRNTPAALTAAAEKEKKVRAPKSVSARAIAAQQADNLREKTWEKLVSGHNVTDFRNYRPTMTFSVGELVRHAKFGDGYVTSVIDKGKVEMMFREGPRTLAHGMEG